MFYPSSLKKDFYKTGEAAELLQVSPKTIYHWTRTGSLKSQMTETGRVSISRSEIIRLGTERSLILPEPVKRDAVYARISSHGKKAGGDLDRQVLTILEKSSDFHLYDPVIIKDTGSGLNTKRKGLLKLISQAENQEIGRIFITHKDRLTRFGFDYLLKLFSILDVQIVVLDHSDDKSPQEELVEDMMSLLASFSGKLYRMRRADKKKAADLIQAIPEEE